MIFKFVLLGMNTEVLFSVSSPNDTNPSIFEKALNERQTARSCDFHFFDTAVYEWFLHEWARHIPISGLI